MKVHFYIVKNRTKKADESTPVMLHCSIQRILIKYSTGLSIEPKYWNAKTERAVKSSQFPSYPEFNNALTEMESKFKTGYSQAVAKYGNKPTADHVKEFTDILFNKQAKGFFNFLGEFADRKGIAKNTARNCKALYNTLQKFEQQTGYKLDFNKFTSTFYTKFFNWSDQARYKASTFNYLITVLKSVLNAAKKAGKLNGNEYKDFKKVAADADEKALTPTEIEAMYNTKTYGTGEERTKDLFILMCHTGLRYSDAIRIRQEHLKANYLEILPKKTARHGKKVQCPIAPTVKAILEKYQNTMPSITATKFNIYIKRIAERAGITEIVSVEVRYLTTTETEQKHKWQTVGSHTGRRSFATNAYNAGKPVHYIMIATGHKSEAVFYKYIKQTPKNIEDIFLNW